MARKQTTAVVEFGDGESRRFQITQMKVRDGHAVLERLLRVGAPVLGALADGLGEADAEKAVAGDLSREGLSGAFDALAANLAKNEGVLDWLTEKLRKGVAVETEEAETFVPLTGEIYEDLFAGEYGAELALVAAGLKANFSTFFKGAGGLSGAVRRFVTPTRSASSSPKASRSGSGGLS